MKLFGQISTYALVGALGAGTNFLLLPYLSHFLSPSDYGVLAMINTLVSILIPLTGIMAFSWISVEYFKKTDNKEFALLFSTVQVVPIIPFLCFALTCYLLKDYLAYWLEVPTEKSYWIALSSVLALFTIYYDTLLNLAVTQQKPVAYGIFNIAKLIVEVVLTVFLVTQCEMGWEGRLLAWLISLIISFGIGTIYFYRAGLLVLRVSKKYFFSSILFGAPLILHTVGKFIVNQSDRIFITKMVSLEALGVYSVGYQIGLAVLLLVSAAGNFFQPYLYERLAKNNSFSKLQVVKMTYLLILLFVVALIALTATSPLIFSWFIDERYSDGTQYVFWVGLSYVFWGIYILMTGYIFFSGKSQFLGKLAILNIVINLTLNYFLISKFGALGAAYATCLSFLIIAAIVSVKANQLSPMPWNSFRLLLNLKSE